jgi:hypothetical protein
VSLLEEFIREDPPLHMTDTVVRNLQYLYELTCEKSVKERKMQVRASPSTAFSMRHPVIRP